MNIEVFDTSEELADAAASRIATVLAETPATLGLAGGSTPAMTYHALRRRDLPWDEITCWISDERWVPADHPDSNTGMARRELTDHLGATLLAPDTTIESPAEAAEAYERELDAAFDGAPHVVLLGIGPDGHTASLFPGTAALEAARTGYVANWVDSLGAWRLTATAPLLQAASVLIFLVSGAGKAPVLRSMLVDEEPYPAQVVAAGAGDVTWLLDAAAAADL